MSAAVVSILSNKTIAVSIMRPGRGAYARAGKQAINQGDITVTIAFTTPLPDGVNYVPMMIVGNPTDNPDLAPLITAHPYSQGANGFTMRLSNGPLTGNYIASWTIAEMSNP